MFETVEPGAIGAAGPGGAGNGCADGAHRRGFGAGPVNELLAELATAVDRATSVSDPEFAGALVVELTRRYLEAVRGHTRGTTVPLVWRVVLGAWNGPDARAGRVALAGAYALAGHDLAPAAVTTCTLLGRTPGAVERGDLQTVAGLLVGLARDVARRDADAAVAEDARELEWLLGRGECWQQAERLWAVRGRPTEAEKDRQALDRRAALVARDLLGIPE